MTCPWDLDHSLSLIPHRTLVLPPSKPLISQSVPSLTGIGLRRAIPAEGCVTHAPVLAVAFGPKAAVRNCSSSSGATMVTFTIWNWAKPVLFLKCGHVIV